MPKDLTDETTGVIIDDSEVPPERPAAQPLDAPIVENFKPGVSTGSALDKIAADLSKTHDTPPDQNALDAAAEDAAEKAEAARVAKEAADKKKAAATPPAKEPTAAEKAAADKIAADKKAVADKTGSDKTPEQVAAERVAADKKAAEDAAAAEPKDELAAVKLPPYVKPPTVNAFAEVKRLARDKISALEKKVSETEAKVPKNGGLTPEVEKELTELRNFRKVYDFKSDPEFQTNFVKPIETNDATIFAKLKESGFTDEQVATVKGIGTANLDWTPVLEKLQPQIRRAIEAKLLDNENVADKRRAAEKAAEGAPAEYEKRRKEAATKAEVEEKAAADTTAAAILEQVPWFKVKDIPLTATADEKKALEADNAFVLEQQARLKDIMSDRSSSMFGTLAASTLLAYQYKRDAVNYKARAEAAETELAKIKKSSKAGARPSSAPQDGSLPKREINIFKTDAGTALDQLAADKLKSND